MKKFDGRKSANTSQSLRELDSLELDQVSGAGSISEGMVGVAITSTSSLSAGYLAAIVFGGAVGGLVAVGIAAAVGTGYVLATSSGGGSTRTRTEDFTIAK